MNTRLERAVAASPEGLRGLHPVPPRSPPLGSGGCASAAPKAHPPELRLPLRPPPLKGFRGISCARFACSIFHDPLTCVRRSHNRLCQALKLDPLLGRG